MIKHIDKLDSLRLKQNEGIYEPNETKLIKSMLKPNSIFVDVGAHIGYYCDLAREIIDTGQIYAFEPNPENFKLLKYNYDRQEKHPYLSSLNNIGISDSVEKGRLYICGNNTGDHRPYETDTEKRESIEISFTTIDDFINVDEINFMKIDTQGYEVKVLKGGKKIIDDSHNINMLIEYCPRLLKLAGDSPGELIGLLVDYGFNIYVHTKRGWIYANSETFQLEHVGHVNLFCSRKKHKEIDWSL